MILISCSTVSILFSYGVYASLSQRLLRNAGAEGQQATAEHAGTGGDAMAVPLWVVVSKEGLQTRIELRGEWVFTNHLPQEVQVRLQVRP